MDMTTLAGQQQHYREVHHRLNPRPLPKVRTLSLPPPPPAPVKAPTLHVVTNKRPVGDRTFRWRFIAREVADKHGLGVIELLSRGRRGNMVAARQELYYRMRSETPLSFPEIGRRLGRDHGTIIYGVKQHMARVATNPT